MKENEKSLKKCENENLMHKKDDCIDIDFQNIESEYSDNSVVEPFILKHLKYIRIRNKLDLRVLDFPEIFDPFS